MKITTRYHEDPYALHIGTEPPRAYYLPQTPDRRPSVIDLGGVWATPSWTPSIWTAM